MLLIGGVGLAVAATRDPSTEILASAPTSTTTPALTTTTTAVPATTTTTSPPETTTTRSSPPTTGRQTTTTARAPTTTIAAASAAACTAAQIQVTAAADMKVYGQSQPVEVSSTLRNASTVPCTYNGYTVEITFVSTTGESFAGASIIADSFRDVVFPPGGALTHSGPWQHIFAPPGSYSAIVTWRFATQNYAVTAAFQLA